MTALDERLTRRWCQDLARRLSKQEIRPHETPYLTRYFAAGWNPVTRQTGPAVFLHHFVASDPSDEVHSHPWSWGLSLMLVGGYREHRCAADGTHSVRTILPGDVNLIAPGDRHRVDLLGPDCWTLFLVGAYQQPWGFFPMCEPRS